MLQNSQKKPVSESLFYTKFLRTPFFTEHLQWLLLNFMEEAILKNSSPRNLIPLKCSHVNYVLKSFKTMSFVGHGRCSVRKSVLRNFAKLTGKDLC